VVYTSEYPIFSVTVDVVCLTVRDDRFQVLLVRRGEEPFKGGFALPGGFVKIDEALETAARRELAEETGVAAPGFLEQLATYGDPDRDPRSRTVSVAYLAVAPDLGDAVGGSDAAEADWHDVDDVLADPSVLAFDHAQIVADAVERARGKLEYYPLAAEFCPPEFTIAELRHVYELIWGTRLDPANFHRKVTKAEGFLKELTRTTTRGGGRPARLFKKGKASRLHPPLMREPR
jgi:8-oxo-dGTP diphosphatase